MMIIGGKKMTKTVENLMAAFAGESQANRRYLAYAKKADDEGYPQVARLFRAAAAAEEIHALNHLKAAGEIKSTAENLKTAMAGENFEVVSMYPPYIEEAEATGDKKATRTFSWAWEVEKIHEGLYRNTLDTLETSSEQFDYYVCPVCGYTHERNAPEKCPVCGAPGNKFVKIN